MPRSNGRQRKSDAGGDAARIRDADKGPEVLCTDLVGRRPDEVRFFEHYRAQLRPIAEWQEVTFASASPLDNRKGLLAKVLGLISGDREPQSWIVDDPRWQYLPSTQVPAAIKALVD